MKEIKNLLPGIDAIEGRHEELYRLIHNNEMQRKRAEMQMAQANARAGALAGLGNMTWAAVAASSAAAMAGAARQRESMTIGEFTDRIGSPEKSLEQIRWERKLKQQYEEDREKLLTAQRKLIRRRRWFR